MIPAAAGNLSFQNMPDPPLGLNRLAATHRQTVGDILVDTSIGRRETAEA